MRTDDEVAVFVIRRAGSEVLILHRSAQHGGYWHVVAGGVEPGETAVEAAVRELHEETGLRAAVADGVRVTEYVDPLTEASVDPRKPGDSEVVAVDVTCFTATAPDTWDPDLDWEHDGYRWCDPSAAAAILRWPATARALGDLLVPGIG